MPCRELLPDIAANIVQLADRDIFQPATIAPQSLVDLDRGFLQHRVRFLRTALENEVIAAGQPGMSVFGVEGQS